MWKNSSSAFLSFLVKSIVLEGNIWLLGPVPANHGDHTVSSFKSLAKLHVQNNSVSCHASCSTLGTLDALQGLVDMVKKCLVRCKTVWFMFTANAYFTQTIKRGFCCVMLSTFHLFISGLKLSHRKWLAKLELQEYFQGTKQTPPKIKNCLHKDNVEKMENTVEFARIRGKKRIHGHLWHSMIQLSVLNSLLVPKSLYPQKRSPNFRKSFLTSITSVLCFCVIQVYFFWYILLLPIPKVISKQSALFLFSFLIERTVEEKKIPVSLRTVWFRWLN